MSPELAKHINEKCADAFAKGMAEGRRDEQATSRACATYAFVIGLICGLLFAWGMAA